MHERFASARIATGQAPGGTVRIVMAESFRLRFLGLMRLEAEEISALLFPRCRSLHMHWMRAPIDIVWLDLSLDGAAGSAGVLGVLSELEPGASAKAPGGLGRDIRRRVGALELPPGQAAALGLEEGAELALRIEPSQSG